MKKLMLLLAVLAISISLIRGISQAKETALLGTWRYKGEEGVIVDYIFTSESKGTMVAKTTDGIFEYQFKYALKDVDGKQYLYTFIEIPEEKVRGVEVSELRFLSNNKIQTQEVNAYTIEEENISLYLLYPLPTASEPKHLFDTTVTRKQILSPGLEEPKILERVR